MSSEIFKEDFQMGLTAPESLGILQHIRTEITAKCNRPQELWLSLRSIFAAEIHFIHPGLLRDVTEFCLAVFDSLEPNAQFDERQRRIASAETMALLLNPRMGGLVKGLSANDNAFLVKWGILTGTNMLVLRCQTNTIRTDLLAFESLAIELQQVDHEEQVLSVWLYFLYSAVFTFAHRRVPAGILGVASFGIGLAVGNKTN